MLFVGLGGCVQELPGYSVCGAATCGPGEYRLCAQDDDLGASLPNEDSICAPLRGLGQACTDQPCSDSAGTVGLCDNGLACRDGVCGAANYLYDLCLTDADCTSGLQCWPWQRNLHSDPAPLPGACNLPYAGPVREDWKEFTGVPLTPGMSWAIGLSAGICFAKPVDGMACDTGCFDCADGLTCVGGRCERPCDDAGDCCRAGATGTCEADQLCDICIASRTPVTQCGTGALGCCRADEGHVCHEVTLLGGSTTSMCCVPTGSATPCDMNDDCCDGARCNPATSRCQECTRDGQALPANGICCDGAAPGPDPQGLRPGLFCLAACTEATGTPCRPCAGTTSPSHYGTWECTVSGDRCVPVMAWPAQDLTCDGVDDDCDGRLDEDLDDDSDDDCDGIDDDCSGGFGGTDPDEIDEDFVDGVTPCMGAVVSGCPGTWPGARRCDPGDPAPLGACIAEAGDHYCKFGSGASPAEYTHPDCSLGGVNCCSLPSLVSIAHNQDCATLGGSDFCSPRFDCRHDNNGAGHQWVCTARSSCGSSTICYEPRARNSTTSNLGDMCPAGAAPL